MPSKPQESTCFCLLLPQPQEYKCMPPCLLFVLFNVGTVAQTQVLMCTRKVL